MAWIGAITGVGIGVVGAIAGITLPFVMKYSGQPLNPEAGPNLAWGFGIGMTACFCITCALFGYLFSIRPARGPRERSFAAVNTVWGSLLVAVLPWLFYGLRNADAEVQSAGWIIIAIYASIRLIGRWQETQMRIRAEESEHSASGTMSRG